MPAWRVPEDRGHVVGIIITIVVVVVVVVVVSMTAVGGEEGNERGVCGAGEARSLFSEEHWRTHSCFHGICTVVKHTLFSPVNKSATGVLNQC